MEAMEKSKKISVEQYCIYYSIEASFVYQLDEYGLIKLLGMGKKKFIAYEHLEAIERYSRLHYDLEINIQGIEAIEHLLGRIKKLQQQMNKLQHANENE